MTPVPFTFGPFAPLFLRGSKPQVQSPKPELLILDGQQRLSSLIYALTAPDLSLKDSQKSLADLNAKLAQLNVTFTSNHPEVKRVQVQIDVLEATLERRNGGLVAKLGSQSIALDDATLTSHPALRSFEGKTVVLGIRPEDLEDVALTGDSPGDQRLKGKVDLTEALGSEIMVHFSIDAKHAVTDDVLELAEDVGDDRVAQPDRAAATATLVGRFGARSRVRGGADVEVAVDTRALHFFDPETGLGIYEGDTGKG